MTRLRFVVSVLVLGVVTSGFLFGEDKKDEKDPIIVKAQLPRHFKQLALSETQRKAVYKVRGKYAAEIEKLKQQIAALQEQETADLENILTDAQKARLKELRAGTTGKEKEPKEKPAVTEKPAAAAEKPAAKPEDSKKK